ncbi:hypothetical protein EIP86_000243 [Pleurotus ostreatoroseus]|nr:hypothetical protein EIP86_000243 [Pleurotus ostreatoroseus]
MSCPILPAEIAESIIDLLRHDKPSLSSASLVCRLWHPRARFHLFSVINVKYPKKFGPFLELLVEKARDPPLCGAPPIPHLVNTVRLCGLDLSRDNHYQPGTISVRPPIVSTVFLTSLLAILPNLKELHLYRVQLHAPLPLASPTAQSVPVVDQNASLKPSIDVLALSGVWTTTPEGHEVLHVLGLFSSIGILCLGKTVCSSFLITANDIVVDGPSPRSAITSSMWFRYRSAHGRSLASFLLSHRLREICTICQMRMRIILDPHAESAANQAVRVVQDAGQQHVQQLVFDLDVSAYFGYAQHPFSRTTERLAIAAPPSVQICGFIFCLKGDCKRRELPHYRRLFREAIQSGRGWLDRILPLRPDNKFVFIFEGTPNALDIHGYLSICEDLCEMVKMTEGPISENTALLHTLLYEYFMQTACHILPLHLRLSVNIRMATDGGHPSERGYTYTHVQSHFYPPHNPKNTVSTSGKWRSRLFMLGFFVGAVVLAIVNHLFFKWLDGRTAGDSQAASSLHLPWSIAAQSLVNAISNSFTTVAAGCLSAVISTAYAQVFWLQMRVKGSSLNKIDEATNFNSTPVNPFNWRVLGRMPKLGALTICSVLLMAIGIAVPGSLTVALSADDYACVVPNVDLSQNVLTNIEKPELGPNGTTQYRFTNPNGRAYSLVTRTFMSGAYFAPDSQCGVCQYNVSYIAPAVQCVNITQATNFSQWLPEQSTWPWVWQSQYDGTNLIIATRNLLGNSSAASSILPDKELPVVALNCSGYSATYHVYITHNISTTLSVTRLDIGDQLSTDNSSQYWSATPASLAHEQLAIWDAYARRLNGSVQYVYGYNEFTASSSQIISMSPLGAGQGVGIAWQWGGEMEVMIPEIMQNISLSLLSGQLSSTLNSTLVSTPTTCRTYLSRYTYQPLRLLVTYGGTLVITGLCLLYAFVATSKNDRSESLDFSRIFRAYPTDEILDRAAVLIEENGQLIPKSRIIHD